MAEKTYPLTIPNSEEQTINFLREYEKLDSLLCLIPRKAQHGILKSCDLILTCIDANTHLIALGSNVGVIFLYDRKQHTIQKFRTVNATDVITSVRLHHGIDDLLATATASGNMSIFCFPGVGSIQKKQVQKFEVSDIHKHYVTCLEWSTNGMKLYSGDKSGQVVTTEIDFYKGLCSSTVLLIESTTEIIQLDYRHKSLLVSTRQRSFVVRLDQRSEIVNVGSKDRKTPYPFGACFTPGFCKTDDAKLYAARPGCRLWLADIKGVVSKTLIFSDPLSLSIPEIPLLCAGKLQVGQPEFQFGILKCFGEKEVVTWSSCGLVVLDPEANRVVACQGRLSGIVDVAVVEEAREIFILRRHAEARVIRIAYRPEVKLYKEILMSTLLPNEEKCFPADKEEKKTLKEADDNSALSFLKKLTIPLKKADKAAADDSQSTQASKIPSPVYSSEKQMSPDLPPIVKIASPELEGVKLYTEAELSSGTDGPTYPEDTTARCLSNADNALKSGIFSMQYLDPADDSIIFRQKGRKGKKRKSKLERSSNIKDKEEDSHSQVSDDLFMTTTPNNTPAVDSPLDTLKKADDLLQHMAYFFKDGGPKDLSDEMQSVVYCQENLINNCLVTNEIAPNAHGASPLVTLEGNTEMLENLNSSENVSESSLAEADQQVEVQPSQILAKLEKPGVEELSSYRSDVDIIDAALTHLELAKVSSTDNLSVSISGQDSLNPQTNKMVLAENHDEYCEVKAIEASNPFKKKYKRSSGSDDFYSHFLDTSPESPESPVSQGPTSLPTDPVILPLLADNRSEMRDVAQRSLANTWSEFTTPANIYSLVVSNSHIWFTDKSENIYYSSIGSAKGVLWRKASGKANQISVSPSGQIVWRLHHGVVHAGTKINSRHPEGMKWVEAIRDVETICVDDRSAWYVKKNGELMMQKGLTLERPCYKSFPVECPYRLKHIVCRQGIVWGITEGLKLVVRTGITDSCPEGTDWQLDSRDQPPYLFSHIAIDHEKICWAIDLLGQIWFCDGVSRENPLGSGLWWQMPLSEYILHDETTLDMIKAVAKKFDPTKLSYILSTNRGGLITAGTQGVWLALDFKNVLQVCRGSVQGYLWILAQPAHISSSVTWKHICANISHLDWGLVWAQQTKTSDLYTFKQARAEATMVPMTSGQDQFCCLSVSPVAAWALTVKGKVMVRAGMSKHCPQGTSWVNLDMSQLGDAQFVHLSCNSLYVWAVEAEGIIYQRIGAMAPDENSLNPVWLPVETFGDIVFNLVYNGPLDWMVWAVDNRRLIYVRDGIREDMPIGKEWIHVPGIQAIDLALTNTGVWALTPAGEIFFRFGISKDRPCGDYWKKIPGIFTQISASANDELWSINRECQLMQCRLRSLTRMQEGSEVPVTRLRSTESVSDEADWEIV